MPWPLGRALPVCAQAGSAASIFHVALVADRGRLGAWLDSVGGWLWPDALCSPSAPACSAAAPAGPAPLHSLT